MMVKNVALVTFKRPIGKPPNFNSPASQSIGPVLGFARIPPSNDCDESAAFAGRAIVKSEHVGWSAHWP